MAMSEVDFGYEAKLETGDFTLYVTEDAVAENIEMVGTSEVTSNAFCGVRTISKAGEVRDFEVFGRLGDKVIDIVSVDTGEEWEDINLPDDVSLGSAQDSELLSAVVKVIK